MRTVAYHIDAPRLTFASSESLTSPDRYLGCDKFGIPSATRDAISPEESFSCEPSSDIPGAFAIRSTRDKYLVIEDGEVRADAEEQGRGTSFRVRMQARYKPTLKASKEEKVLQKISRAQLEQEVGRKLQDDEAKKLKRARKEGTYHEALLDIKVKGKHDKFA